MAAKETTYVYRNGENAVEVTARDRHTRAMLRKMAQKYPEEVKITSDTKAALVGTAPFEWVKIAPKRKVELSPEKRAAAAERMRALRETKQSQQK